MLIAASVLGAAAEEAMFGGTLGIVFQIGRAGATRDQTLSKLGRIPVLVCEGDTGIGSAESMTRISVAEAKCSLDRVSVGT